MIKKIILAVVLVVLVAGFGWYRHQTQSYTGSDITYSLIVERERPLVWHYLTDAGYRKLWMANLEDLTAVGGIPYEPGERTLVTLVIDRVPYEYTETVTAIDPPTYWALDLEAEGFEGHVVYELHDLEDGRTEVVINREVEYTSVLAILMEPFLEEREMDNLVAGLAKMKRLAESAPARELDEIDLR